MKTIIAGCRKADNYDDLLVAIDTIDWEISEVICGDAVGADAMGCKWAESQDIPVVHCPAKWDKYGKEAGVRRNTAMLNQAEALVALWDGISSGTGHMIQIALAAGIQVFIQRID